MDGEEVGRVGELADQFELVAERLADIVRHAAGIITPRPDPGEPFELLLRAAAAGHRVDRIFVAQLVEAEVAALGDLDRARERFGVTPKEPRHLRRRLQVPLGIDVEQRARLADGAVLADAAHHVLQHPPLGDVVLHVVGGDELQLVRFGILGQHGKTPRVVAAKQRRGGEEGVRSVQRLQRGKPVREFLGWLGWRQRHEDQPFAMLQHIIEADRAVALLGAQLAEGQ